MIYLKLIYIIIVSLPEIIKLIQALQKQSDDQAVKDKVNNDVAAIKEAFKKRDADALRRIFNS